MLKIGRRESDPGSSEKIFSATRATWGTDCGVRWPPLTGGMVRSRPRLLSLLPAVNILVLPRLLELLLTESTEVGPVARSTWVLHLPLALVLGVAVGPPGADLGGVVLSSLDSCSPCEGNLLLNCLLRVSCHRLHHISRMHLWPNLCPGCGTSI